jgi:hypothetical protein
MLPNCCVEKNTEGRRVATAELQSHSSQSRGIDMHQIIYIVGLIVVVLAILSFFGLR